MLKLLKTAILAISLLPGLCHAQATQSASTSQPSHEDQKIIAQVLGTNIVNTNQGQLQELILKPLYDHYVKENGLEPTEAELETFVEFSDTMQSQRPAEYQKLEKELSADLAIDTLSEQERAQKVEHLKIVKSMLAHYEKREQEEAAFNRQATTQEKEARRASLRQTKLKGAGLFVQNWKLFKSLYQTYGGRVAAQKFCPIPIDACIAFLKEEKGKGHFTIFDPELEKEFWEKLSAKPFPSVILDQEKVDQVMSQPYWLQHDATGY